MHSFSNSRQLCLICSDQEDMLYSVFGQSIQAWHFCVTSTTGQQLPGNRNTGGAAAGHCALQHSPSALLLTAG